MLQSHEPQPQTLESSLEPTTNSEQWNLDEPTRMAYYLFNCSKKFIATEPIQVLPAMKCLYMALSMVLAPQIEVELRLKLGNLLLDYTKNYNEALEQVQKAHQLAESVNIEMFLLILLTYVSFLVSRLVPLNLMKSAESQDL